MREILHKARGKVKVNLSLWLTTHQV